MLQTRRKKPTFRVNGRKVRGGTYVPPSNSNSRYTYTPGKVERARHRISELAGKYGIEKLVGYMAISLMMVAGFRLAIQAGYGDPFMIAGQIAGFTASTVYIMRLKYKLGEGKYIGRQRRSAEKQFYTGVAFESLTLFAKFFPVIIPFYLGTVVFTIPALVIGSFRLTYLDPVRRAENDRNEKEILASTLVERQEILTEKMEIVDGLGKLEAEDLTHEIKRAARIKLVKKNQRRIEAIAIRENEDYLEKQETAAGYKWKKKMLGGRKMVKLQLPKMLKKGGVSEAKVLPPKKNNRNNQGRPTKNCPGIRGKDADGNEFHIPCDKGPGGGPMVISKKQHRCDCDAEGKKGGCRRRASYYSKKPGWTVYPEKS